MFAVKWFTSVASVVAYTNKKMSFRQEATCDWENQENLYFTRDVAPKKNFLLVSERAFWERPTIKQKLWRSRGSLVNASINACAVRFSQLVSRYNCLWFLIKTLYQRNHYFWKHVASMRIRTKKIHQNIRITIHSCSVLLVLCCF